MSGVTALATVADCRLLALPRIESKGGSLSVVEGGREPLPFELRRVYWIHGLQAGATRGGHAHEALEEVFVAVAGGFDVRLRDGTRERTVRLERPDHGLYVPGPIWRDLSNFTAGAAVLVLASQPFEPDRYYRDWETFRRLRRGPD